MRGATEQEEELFAARRMLVRLRSFAIAVRMAQVRYFKTRHKEDLIASKSAEARLDKELFGKSLTVKELENINGQRTAGDVSPSGSQDSTDDGDSTDL